MTARASTTSNSHLEPLPARTSSHKEHQQLRVSRPCSLLAATGATILSSISPPLAASSPSTRLPPFPRNFFTPPPPPPYSPPPPPPPGGSSQHARPSRPAISSPRGSGVTSRAEQGWGWGGRFVAGSHRRRTRTSLFLLLPPPDPHLPPPRPRANLRQSSPGILSSSCSLRSSFLSVSRLLSTLQNRVLVLLLALTSTEPSPLCPGIFPEWHFVPRPLFCGLGL